MLRPRLTGLAEASFEYLSSSVLKPRLLSVLAALLFYYRLVWFIYI